MADLSGTGLRRTRDVFGSQHVAEFLYTGPAAYPNAGAPGDPIEADELGLPGIEVFPSFVATDDTDIYHCVYDYGSGTIRWYVGTTGVETANGVNLSAFTARIIVFG